ncbi:MAG: FHA domain-containing protein [Gemmatimonadales bacterium]
MTEDSVKGASWLVYEFERRAYPLSDAPFTIGRDATSGIVIREPAVSRSHAEVRSEGDSFMLHPTGATGTRLNGDPVSTPVKLGDGDRIEIGSAEITFREGRLPLGVSVVDTASVAGHDPDAMTRRATIANPILGGSRATPENRKSMGTTVMILLVAAVAVVYFLVIR